MHFLRNKEEQVMSDGRLIATFVNGNFETEDAEVIAKLKERGYKFDEPKAEEKKEEPKAKVKK